MSDVANGGISITLGDYVLPYISGYTARWEDEADGNSFENWDFSRKDYVKGRRFYLDVTTSPISADKRNELLSALYKRTFKLICPDYEGTVRVSSVSAPLTAAGFLGEWYTVSFTAAAVALDSVPDSGGL